LAAWNDPPDPAWSATNSGAYMAAMPTRRMRASQNARHILPISRSCDGTREHANQIRGLAACAGVNSRGRRGIHFHIVKLRFTSLTGEFHQIILFETK